MGALSTQRGRGVLMNEHFCKSNTLILPVLITLVLFLITRVCCKRGI